MKAKKLIHWRATIASVSAISCGPAVLLTPTASASTMRSVEPPPPPPPPPALAAINSPVTALRSVVALSISVCVIVGSAAVTSSRNRVTVHVNRSVPAAAMAWAAVAGGSAAARIWRRRLFVHPRIVVPLPAIAWPAVAPLTPPSAVSVACVIAPPPPTDSASSRIQRRLNVGISCRQVARESSRRNRNLSGVLIIGANHKVAVVKNQRVVNLDIPANVSTVGMGVCNDRWVDVAGKRGWLHSQSQPQHRHRSYQATSWIPYRGQRGPRYRCHRRGDSASTPRRMPASIGYANISGGIVKQEVVSVSERCQALMSGGLQR